MEKTKEREFQDVFFLRDSKKPVHVTLRYLMSALERRQASEGWIFGYLRHCCREDKYGDTRDLAVVKALIRRGFDLQDIYEFMNSRTGRHFGDSLEEATTAPAITASIRRNAYESPEVMYKNFRMDGQAKTVWSGVKVILDKEGSKRGYWQEG